MGIFDSIRNTFQPRSFELKKNFMTDTPSPVSFKETPRIPRIPRDLLEQTYMTDPEIFNTVNKMVQTMMSVDYHLRGDERSVNFFENFFDMIGNRGGEETWRGFRYKLYQYQLIYGLCPTENIFGETTKEIVDLDIIDPKRFDYAKGSNFNNIAFDRFGNPLGYVEIRSYGGQIEQLFPTPKGVSLLGNELFIPPTHVAMFKLYEVGDGFYPMGVVEPAYMQAVYHKTADEGFANFMHRLGNALLGIKVGDGEGHYPTEDQLKQAVEMGKDINSKSVLAYPFWNEPKIIESKTKTDLKPNLEYYVDRKVTAMGMAKPLVASSGEPANRSTLNTQQFFSKLTLKYIIDKTHETIETKIMARIVEEYNKNHPTYKLTVPRFVGGEVMMEELNEKAVRLAKYAQVGLLPYSLDIENMIRESEGLEPRKEEPMEENANGNSKGGKIG